MVMVSRTSATSDVVLPTSVDLAVVVPDDTVCVTGCKFVSELIYGSGDKASGVRALPGAFLLATRELSRWASVAAAIRSTSVTCVVLSEHRSSLSSVILSVTRKV